jgi:hypothetical protein
MNDHTYNFSPQIPTIFSCEYCHYMSSSKKDYNKHLSTLKHQRLTNTYTNTDKIVPQLTCICGKSYKHRQSLYNHKKICDNIIKDVSINESINDSINDSINNSINNSINDSINIKHYLDNEQNQQQLVDYLMKENSEFKQLMIEQNKQMLELAKNSGTHNSHNNINNNTNNFNLQFFLNETCKDAMNIMEFVGQLQVSIKDLEETGRLGYAEGISKIFINGLKQINISDRPIHCSDSKREVVYIKDKNEWTKEDDNKSLLTNAIKHVAHKNMKQIKEWTKVNPEYNDSSSKQNDRYLKIVSNSMNGSTEEEQKNNMNKIISKVAKEITINKCIN